MSEDLKKSILEQELDDDQLNLVVGGGLPGPPVPCTLNLENSSHCTTASKRDAKTDGCAATVEANSWCKENDACLYNSVDYAGCFKADVDCTFSYKSK